MTGCCALGHWSREAGRVLAWRRATHPSTPGAPDVRAHRPVLGGPGLPQERRLVTEIPGPRSQALQARKAAAVAAGVGTTLPVYAVAAGGGVVVDVDGNSLIDLGSGIAVTTVGNSAPRVVEAVARRRSRPSRTPASWSRRTTATSRSPRRSTGSPPATTTSGPRCSTPAPRPSRTPSRSPGRYTRKQAVVAFDHAYHGRTNLTMALTAKTMPYKSGFGPFAAEVYRAPMSYPFRDGGRRRRRRPPARPSTSIEKQVGAENLAALVIEPIQGEGGFIVPAPGFLADAARSGAGTNGVVFIADEVQTGFARTGEMFAVRPRGRRARPDRDRQGDRRRPAALRRDRPRRDHGRPARGRPRRHLRRQPDRLRGRPRRDRDDRGTTGWSTGPARSRSRCWSGCTALQPPTRGSATSAAAAP